MDLLTSQTGLFISMFTSTLKLMTIPMLNWTPQKLETLRPWLREKGLSQGKQLRPKRKIFRTLLFGRKQRRMNLFGNLPGAREGQDGTSSALLWLLLFSRNSQSISTPVALTSNSPITTTRLLSRKPTTNAITG